jgi:adenylate cyclase
MIILMSMIASVLSFLKTELDRKQVRDAFGLYISPDFMKELTSDPDKLQLGGEIRDMTVMFTDIRSFTTISEGLEPQDLIALMNDFLTPMSDLVMQNRGTIDKYMGDAMMAFWNAPLEDPEHAKNACKAALGMQKALEPINKELAAKAEKTGAKPIVLQAGIGINTGASAVGNMGSKQRFAYSTLGDSVNLASRLEGQTKNYGVDILIGDETSKAVSDYAVLEMDLIQVKGKTKPERIHALIGDAETAQTDAFKVLKKEHNEMIALYQKGDFKKALAKVKACRKCDEYNLAKAYDVYEERCKALIKTPPETPWTGVYIATSK